MSHVDATPAARIHGIVRRLRRLGPDRRDPERYHVERDGLCRELLDLARDAGWRPHQRAPHGRDRQVATVVPPDLADRLAGIEATLAVVIARIPATKPAPAPRRARPLPRPNGADTTADMFPPRRAAPGT